MHKSGLPNAFDTDYKALKKNQSETSEYIVTTIALADISGCRNHIRTMLHGMVSFTLSAACRRQHKQP